MAMTSAWADQAPGSFPTASHYVDDGCEVSPKCLECPLPLCRYDDPQGFENWQEGRRGQGTVRSSWLESTMERQQRSWPKNMGWTDAQFIEFWRKARGETWKNCGPA